MWHTSDTIFWRQPTVLDGCKIWQMRTVLECCKVVVLFPPFHRIVVFAIAVAAVAIFFEHKIMMRIEPWFDSAFQDLLNINGIRHFAIRVARNLIKVYVRLEVPTHGSPTMESFTITVLRLWIPLNALEQYRSPGFRITFNERSGSYPK